MNALERRVGKLEAAQPQRGGFLRRHLAPGSEPAVQRGAAPDNLPPVEDEDAWDELILDAPTFVDALRLIDAWGRLDQARRQAP